MSMSVVVWRGGLLEGCPIRLARSKYARRRCSRINTSRASKADCARLGSRSANMRNVLFVPVGWILKEMWTRLSARQAVLVWSRMLEIPSIKDKGPNPSIETSCFGRGWALSFPPSAPRHSAWRATADNDRSWFFCHFSPGLTR